MIRIQQLTKRYGDVVAVDQVSFECEPGRVTGFLGPNGAGKTTTLRVLVGLTPATRGEVTIGGHRFVEIPNPGCHVGVLLDASAQHAGRTGREVLTLSAKTMGLPSDRVEEMLALVSLTETEAKRRVRDYSLGMRQRLGIANALMGDPSVLILDEPANWLDPAGIRWMRDLLRSYANRGGTVLLSSHLLHEVEQLAHELVLIGRGSILAQGDKASLLGGQGRTVSTLVTSLDNQALHDALAQAGTGCAAEGTGLRVHAEPVVVGRVAAEHGIVLTDLRGTGAGVEDLFLELTDDTQRDVIPQRSGSARRDGAPGESISQGAPS